MFCFSKLCLASNIIKSRFFLVLHPEFHISLPVKIPFPQIRCFYAKIFQEKIAILGFLSILSFLFYEKTIPFLLLFQPVGFCICSGLSAWLDCSTRTRSGLRKTQRRYRVVFSCLASITSIHFSRRFATGWGYGRSLLQCF